MDITNIPGLMKMVAKTMIMMVLMMRRRRRKRRSMGSIDQEKSMNMAMAMRRKRRLVGTRLGGAIDGVFDV